MKKYDLVELENSENEIKSKFDELEKSVIRYFRDFGDGNGMEFEHEFVKYLDRIKEYKDKYESIFRRVRNRIESNIDLNSDDEVKDEPKKESQLKHRTFTIKNKEDF